MLREIYGWIGWLLLIISLAVVPASAATDDKLSQEELSQLLAPIALYPDDLLTNVLMASTYPLDVVQASRWRAEPANAKLKGDALAKVLEKKDWDPSVKALVQFPDVLKMMSEKLDWTQKLGDAFLAQQDDVMSNIQFLRQKADEAGNLKSNKQQKVVRETSSSGQPVYVIQPATPETVYVPVYQPTVVYGSWPYPSYPPYYWPYPGAAYVDGYFWGTGVAIAAGIWGWNHFNWHNHDIDIDVNKWNNINIDRDKINNGKWEHRVDHRGNVPYRNKDVRDKFKQGDRSKIGNKDYRGFDKDRARSELDRSKIEAKLKDGGPNAIKDKAGNRGDGQRRDNIGAEGRKDKAGNRPKPSTRPADKGGKRDVARSTARPKAKQSPAAFDVKRGSDVRKASSRGHASRAMSYGGGGGRPSVQRAPSRSFGGGGHRGGGGGRGGRR